MIVASREEWHTATHMYIVSARSRNATLERRLLRKLVRIRVALSPWLEAAQSCK